MTRPRSSQFRSNEGHQTPTITIGGMPIAVRTRAETAELMPESAQGRERGVRPLCFKSTSGEMIAPAVSDPQRWLCRAAPQEWVATTDLFHNVARLAQENGHDFYPLGASPSETARAVAQVRKAYQRLTMGVPREQKFIRRYSATLPNVDVIKTSEGLFKFLSGTNARTSSLMQREGPEWAFRLLLKPKRLFWRFFSINRALSI